MVNETSEKIENLTVRVVKWEEQKSKLLASLIPIHHNDFKNNRISIKC